MDIKKFIEKRRNKIFWKPVILFKDFLGYIEHDLFSFYYLKTGIIFIYIPKVATSSLRNSFRKKIYFYEKRRGSITRTGSMPPKFINLNKYFVFSFVRNPFDRLVSCYYEHLREFYKDSHISFKEFVNKVSKIPDEQADMHFKSQVCYLMKDGKLITNFIGRFENIDKDFNKLCKQLNIDSKLHHLNNTNGRKHYRSYYDDETRKLIEERYKDDLKVFGYNF